MDGDEIRAARERLGMTQQELADQLGVTPKTVGNWENSRTVPKNRAAAIQRLIAESERPAASDAPSVSDASTVELLNELLRRERAAERRAREENVHALPAVEKNDDDDDGGAGGVTQLRPVPPPPPTAPEAAPESEAEVGYDTAAHTTTELTARELAARNDEDNYPDPEGPEGGA